MSSAPSSARAPNRAAGLLQHMFEAVPTWEYGAVNHHNSLRLAESALGAGGEAAQQGACMALLAWQRHPLDVRSARMAHALFPHSPGHGLAGAVAAWCAIPPGGAQDAAQLAAMDEAAMLTLLKRMLPDPKHGGFWLAQGLRWCRQRPEAGETCRRLLDMADKADKAAPEALAQDKGQLWRRLWAQWAQLHLSPAEALVACTTDMPAFGLWQNLGRAHALAALGRQEEARSLVRNVWEFCPSHPNLILTLYDLENPLPVPPSTEHAPPPPLALYSWNKADVLRQTLLSLRDTEGVHAPVFVLDNGSTDGTADMLRTLGDTWPVAEGTSEDSAGPGLRVLSLPVNIGAPAARNWLLSLPEIRRHGSVIFLDDDLLLEPGWLHSLRAAAHAHPQAAVLGCRIVDHTPPQRTQCADFFLLPQEQGTRSFLDLQEHIFLHCDSMGSSDSLLTAYTRPCLSVSGCCHWLRLDKYPSGFDVRFSPSQFDDPERDMRVALAGQEVLYVGQTRIRHMQHSSLRQAHTRARSAHIFGNKIKLEFLHNAAATEKARQHSAQAARRDLLRKITRLATEIKV